MHQHGKKGINNVKEKLSIFNCKFTNLVIRV